MNENELNNLYREFRTQVFPRLNGHERIAKHSDMKLWISLGLVYCTDEDQGIPRYGLTTRGSEVRGVRQFERAIKAHQEQKDRMVAALCEELIAPLRRIAEYESLNTVFDDLCDVQKIAREAIENYMIRTGNEPDAS